MTRGDVSPVQGIVSFPAPTLIDPLAAYRTMYAIRRFEEQVLDLHAAGSVAGSVHLCAGQEAIPVGALSVLNDLDRVVATYRGHGWAIACGVPLRDLLAEICGRATGTNGGRGGSAYLSSYAHRFVGENSIVGAGVPVAGGLALASALQGQGGVAVVSFGDGATNQGSTHEGIVMAVARKLPVVYVCENNGWSEMTPTSATIPGAVSRRAATYGLPAHVVDGNDPEAVAVAVSEAAERARRAGGPTFLECVTGRLWGHYQADVEHYRASADREAAATGDPLPRLRAGLLERGLLREDELAALERGVEDEVSDARNFAESSPFPDAASAAEHVVQLVVPERRKEPMAGVEMTFAKAVNRALHDELAARPEAILFGEDVAIPGGVFGATRGLRERFGDQRVFDTPISESAILGAALGAALEGSRPIVEIMWSDFLLVALDQLINQAANVRYLQRGTRSAPLVVRTQQGATPGSCAQHSQSLEALLAHIPGLRVGLPATPHDAYNMLRAAIADPDPCVIIESRTLYQSVGLVAVDEPIGPIGGSVLRRNGRDLALITWGTAVAPTLEAAGLLAADGVDSSVLDLRWLNPLDWQSIADVVASSGRVAIVHEANLTGGFGAEVAARIAEHAFDRLDAPVTRIATPDVRIPASPVLQAALLPTATRIAEGARALLDQ